MSLPSFRLLSQRGLTPVVHTTQTVTTVTSIGCAAPLACLSEPVGATRVLSAEQADLSGHYAKREGHEALAEHFIEGASGEPKLLGALAHFTCATDAVHPGGDHQIIVGEVISFESVAGDPLVFFAGGYRALS